jgi:hypothetical protein
MKNEFLNTCEEVLKFGTEFQIKNALEDAIEKLRCVFEQANAQFQAGDRHATFTKQLETLVT